MLCCVVFRSVVWCGAVEQGAVRYLSVEEHDLEVLEGESRDSNSRGDCLSEQQGDLRIGDEVDVTYTHQTLCCDIDSRQYKAE